MTEAAIVPMVPEKPGLPQPADTGSAALMRLIERAATDPGFDVAKLEKLLEMRERWKAGEAREAFTVALSAFKAHPPTVKKNKRAGFESKRTGDKTSYEYATLDNVVAAIAPALSAHGLSHRWETEQHEGGMIRVTCILNHVLGHSERVTLQASPDQSGSKNNIQAVGSTVSYLARYTLLAACGLATADMDDDGEDSGQVDYVTEKQAMDLETFCESVGGDKAKFLRQFAADSFATLPAAQYGAAMNLLEKKKAAQK